MDNLGNVEEVVESTTTEQVEEVVESTTTDDLSFSDDDILGVETNNTEEPEEELLTEEEETPISNTQKRFNELTSKIKSAESKAAQTENMNKYLLTQLEKFNAASTVPAPAPDEPKEPVYDDFLEKNDHDTDKAQKEYLAAMVSYQVKNQFKSVQNEERKRQETDMAIKAESEFVNKSYTPEVINKYPDFIETVFSPTVQFTPIVRHLIHTSPNGHDIANHLAKNQDARDRVNSLSPAEAGKVIGLLEGRFSSSINKKLKSAAPEPIGSIGNKARAKKVKEEDLPMDEFMEIENKRINAAQGF